MRSVGMTRPIISQTPRAAKQHSALVKRHQTTFNATLAPETEFGAEGSPGGGRAGYAAGTGAGSVNRSIRAHYVPRRAAVHAPANPRPPKPAAATEAAMAKAEAAHRCAPTQGAEGREARVRAAPLRRCSGGICAKAADSTHAARAAVSALPSCRHVHTQHRLRALWAEQGAGAGGGSRGGGLLRRHRHARRLRGRGRVWPPRHRRLLRRGSAVLVPGPRKLVGAP